MRFLYAIVHSELRCFGGVLGQRTLSGRLRWSKMMSCTDMLVEVPSRRWCIVSFYI
jgi:hypothetical protein